MTSRGMLPAPWSCAFRPIATAAYGCASRPARPRWRRGMAGWRCRACASRRCPAPRRLSHADHLRRRQGVRQPAVERSALRSPIGLVRPAADLQAKVTLVSRGPLCTAVRVTGRYVQADGKAPPSAPQAVYDWLYLADRPLVLVRAAMQQKEPSAWPEVHFLELDYPREAFPRWAGGEPWNRVLFTASKKSFTMPQWGADPRRDAGHRHDAVPAKSCSTTGDRAAICKHRATRPGRAGAKLAGSAPHGSGSAAPRSRSPPSARPQCQPADLRPGDRYHHSRPRATGKGRP